MMICYHVKKRHKGSSCRFELLADEWRGSLLRRLTFCGYFLNLFDCRCVFAYLLFLFNECVTKERLALSHIQLNPCFTDTRLVRVDTSLLRTVYFVPWERKALIWTLSMTPSMSVAGMTVQTKMLLKSIILIKSLITFYFYCCFC